MGSGIHLSRIGFALQADGYLGLPNGCRRLIGGGRYKGGRRGRYSRLGSLRDRSCWLRRGQTGSEGIQFSIAYRRVSDQRQNSADREGISHSGAYPP